MKFSALNVDFNSASFDPLGSRSPPYELLIVSRTSASNLGRPTPFKTRDFCYSRLYLAREWLQIDTDLLRIITSTADELSGSTNIDDLKRP